MIDKDEAKRIQAEFRRNEIPDINNPAPKQWPSEPIMEPYYENSAWWFIYSSPGGRREGIVVRDDRSAHVLLGAMASLYYSDPPRIGLPRSSERFLGSTNQGRYQLFDNGIGVWEVPNERELAYFVPQSDQQDMMGGRTVTGLTAFFDLRGFTLWSSQMSEARRAREIQELIEKVEIRLQAAFGRYYRGNLFFKWTGDGAMLVSEEPRVGDFFRACCRGVIEISRLLPPDLAVGCGITKGEITQLFMLGRYDYIGKDVNEAAKLQQLTWNELLITAEVYNDLLSEGFDIRDARRIGVKGYRVDPERNLEIIRTKGEVP